MLNIKELSHRDLVFMSFYYKNVDNLDNLTDYGKTLIKCGYESWINYLNLPKTHNFSIQEYMKEHIQSILIEISSRYEDLYDFYLAFKK